MSLGPFGHVSWSCYRGARMEASSRRALVSVGLLVAVTVLAHAAALATPLFASETRKLVENPAITSVSAFVDRMLTPRGLVQRPLGLFTFTLDHHWFGLAPVPYFATNLAIHVVCTVLVWVLARHYVARPLVPALIFGVHPLSTGVVVELFGRYYSLATAFMLLALIWLHRHETAAWLTPWSLAVLGVLFALMVTSKQVLVFFVAIVAWLWVSRRSADAPAAGRQTAGGWAVGTAWILAAVGILVAAAFVAFYAVPFSRTAPVSPLVFFQSQLGNLDWLVELYVVPHRIAVMMLYPFHRTLDLKVFTGAVIAVAAVVVAVRWRARPWGFLLGALLIALVPTNTVFPKDQLVLKWRLYPSMVFAALLLGYALDRVFDRATSATGRALLATVFAGYLAFMVTIDWRQNTIYRDELASFEQMAATFPDVPDGHMIAARECFRRRLYARALPHLRHARDVGYRGRDLTQMLGYLERRGIGP